MFIVYLQCWFINLLILLLRWFYCLFVASICFMVIPRTISLTQIMFSISHTASSILYSSSNTGEINKKEKLLAEKREEEEVEDTVDERTTTQSALISTTTISDAGEEEEVKENGITAATSSSNQRENKLVYLSHISVVLVSGLEWYKLETSDPWHSRPICTTVLSYHEKCR